MAITFTSTLQAWYSQANWLDSISSFSLACWARLDSFSAGVRQSICGHNGSTNYLRLQKDTNDQWHCCVAAGGVLRQVWDTTGTVASGTLYHLCATWQTASATGLKIYRNGSYVATTSTVAQTVAYNSGGNVDFYINGIANLLRSTNCTVEGLCIWTGYVLDAEQVAALYHLGWPHLAVPAKPAAYWPLNGGLLSRIPDGSGNARHIESSGIDSGITNGGLVGKYEDPWVGPSATHRQYDAGPPPPPAWIYWDTITHPTATSTVTGLTNGTTYEFKVYARDTSDNLSTESDVVEGTPAASSIIYTHTARRKWGGR